MESKRKVMCALFVCAWTQCAKEDFVRTFTRVLLTLRRPVVDETTDVEGVNTLSSMYQVQYKCLQNA